MVGSKRNVEGSATVRALPLSSASDADLATQAGRGHPGAAREVWKRHAGLVRGLLGGTLGSAELDDHVQQLASRDPLLAEYVPCAHDASTQGVARPAGGTHD